MTSDNIAEYVGENNQFTEKPVTEYPPVIQDNTVTTKDYLYSNNIDTDLLVVIGGLIVILFLMMLIMYFINSLRHKELTEILTKISFPEKSGSNLLKPEAVSCNLLSLCVLAPVFCTPRKLAEVSREIIVASAQEIAWTPGSSRIDGHQAENITLNRPGFPGECFICELRLPDHRFRWKHNKLFLLLPEEYGPAFPAIVDCYTSPPT